MLPLEICVLRSVRAMGLALLLQRGLRNARQQPKQLADTQAKGLEVCRVETSAKA